MLDVLKTKSRYLLYILGPLAKPSEHTGWGLVSLPLSFTSQRRAVMATIVYVEIYNRSKPRHSHPPGRGRRSASCYTHRNTSYFPNLQNLSMSTPSSQRFFTTGEQVKAAYGVASSLDDLRWSEDADEADSRHTRQCLQTLKDQQRWTTPCPSSMVAAGLLRRLLVCKLNVDGRRANRCIDGTEQLKIKHWIETDEMSLPPEYSSATTTEVAQSVVTGSSWSKKSSAKH